MFLAQSNPVKASKSHDSKPQGATPLTDCLIYEMSSKNNGNDHLFSSPYNTLAHIQWSTIFSNRASKSGPLFDAYRE
jgi:hypothetical protein